MTDLEMFADGAGPFPEWFRLMWINEGTEFAVLNALQFLASEILAVKHAGVELEVPVPVVPYLDHN